MFTFFVVVFYIIIGLLLTICCIFGLNYHTFRDKKRRELWNKLPKKRLSPIFGCALIIYRLEPTGTLKNYLIIDFRFLKVFMKWKHFFESRWKILGSRNLKFIYFHFSRSWLFWIVLFDTWIFNFWKNLFLCLYNSDWIIYWSG